MRGGRGCSIKSSADDLGNVCSADQQEPLVSVISADQQEPLVSVIIPAFNAERFVEESVRSVLEQTHRNIEILVVDDGSTDGTASILRKLEAEDTRLRVIHQSNQGVASARNRGVEEAQGLFVAPLDADDVWARRKLELQVKALLEDSGAGLAYCWTQRIDERGFVIYKDTIRCKDEGDVLHSLVRTNIVGHASGPLMRTEVVRACGAYDVSLRERSAQGCEDLKLYLSIARRHPFVLVPQYLVGYRRTRESMSANIDQMLRSHHLVMQELREVEPGIPEAHFRRSSSQISSWLLSRCRFSRDLKTGVKLFRNILLLDPAFIVSRWPLHKVPRVVRRVIVLRAQWLGNRFPATWPLRLLRPPRYPEWFESQSVPCSGSRSAAVEAGKQ
ncbi:MAG: glycosyltransferase family 2 protein [Acidimicrobiia bacterium]|nr:glycosyltransferase family 2 protein [Acidimicrobiia bacterium]